MASDIEQVIEEMENFIEEKGKPTPFSSNKITLNKDELQGYLEELRATTPDEIRRYQKIINNRDAIIADARRKAEQIIEQAQVKTDELVSEHQIMQQAYAQANQVVMIATKNAQEMLDKATMEANDIKTGAITYTDDLLSSVQSVLSNSLDVARLRNQNFIDKLQDILNQVIENRNELAPGPEVETEAPASAQPAIEEEPVTEEETSAPVSSEENTDSPEKAAIDVPEQFFRRD